MPDTHDNRYKKLFSNPLLVQELLEAFVHEDFVRKLEFSKMIRLDKTFVGRRFRRKEADLIYRIPINGKQVYVYLLLEFQSTVDRFLSLRMLRYICEFYEFLLEQPGKLHTLPPVFPLLVYNGDRNWNAPDNIRTLIRPQLADKYLPSFRYYKIIEKDIPDSTLRDIHNAVSAVFYLEKSSSRDLGKRIKELSKIVSEVNHPIIKLLRSWINDYIKDFPDIDKNDAILLETLPIKERDSMFETALKGYVELQKQEAIKAGKAEGLAEGKAEGKAEGILWDKQQTLIRLLDHKFGISAQDRSLIESCRDPELLDSCLDVILDAATLAEVMQLFSQVQSE